MKRIENGRQVKLITKGDILLLAAVAFFAIIGLVIWLIQPQGEVVCVYRNGKKIAEYALHKDGVYTVTSEAGFNTVTVKGGTVCVTEADCSNGVCMRYGAISRVGQSIVCAPHGITVKIEGNSGIDAILSWEFSV